MAIIVVEQPDIYLTEGELRKLRDEYRNTFSMYCGTPPSFEEFVRSRCEKR